MRARPTPRFVRAACVLPLVAAFAAPAAAQQADSAALVTVLGRDTLALERWVRTPRQVTAEAVVRAPRTTYRRHVLDLAADGRMRRFEERIFDPSAPDTPVRTDVYEAAEGGWTRTLTQGDSTVTARVEAPGDALPWMDLVHWPFELALMRAVGSQGGTQPMLVGGRTLAYGVAPAQGGGWTLTHPLRGPSVARVDERGRLASLDAAGTTRKVVVTRVPWMDVMGPATRWAQADREGRGVGELSGRGQVDTNVEGARITADFGVPQRRGREIFGQVVPWGQVWRTGANRATHFTTDRELEMRGADGATLRVPAGEYTLYTIPERDGGWLIVNRQTGQGGTTYDQARDLGRVRMARTMVDDPREAFEIRVVESCAGGDLQIAWDRTVFSVPFRVP